MTHAEALTQLMAVAGELVRLEGIPDPYAHEFHQLTRGESIELGLYQIRRAKQIRDAVEVLRKP